MGLFSFLTREVAIDLGTANSIVICNDKVVVDEPSIVAVDQTTKKIIAVGKKAMQMDGKTHDAIKTIRPLRDGVIADFDMANDMIRELIRMINMKKTIIPPSLKMVICIPSGITNVEERAVRDAAEQAGAKDVRLIHEPMAAAIGIGIDVLEPVGNMIIDIGGGTSEIAVIALGGIVCNKSIRKIQRFVKPVLLYLLIRCNKMANVKIGIPAQFLRSFADYPKKIPLKEEHE